MPERVLTVHAELTTAGVEVFSPGGRRSWRIDAIYIANRDGSDRTVTIHHLKADETTATNASILLKTGTVPTLDTLDLELTSPIYLQPDESITMVASADSTLVAHVSASEL
jgi:hypothetical protein